MRSADCATRLTRQINRLAISPNKKYLAAAGSQSIKLYDIAVAGLGPSGQNPGHGVVRRRSRCIADGQVASFEGHTANVTCLAWHCDGKWIVSGSEDGSIRIWDTRAATVQRNFDSKSPVNDVVIHPNQGELVSCDQAGSIKVWDLTANNCTHELLPEEDTPMRSVSVAQDGSCLVGGNNAGRVYIWSIRNGSDFTDLQPKTKFDAHDKYLIRCMLSPDGKCVRLSLKRADQAGRWRRVRPTRRSRRGPGTATRAGTTRP